jgi:hypothetical protein
MKIIACSFLLLILFSCNSIENDASIRNAIASEAQLQQMNVMLYGNGERYASNIREEFGTTPKNQEMISKNSKLLFIMNKIDQIDSLTAAIIHSIDQLKISLLKEAGENYPINKERSVLPSTFDFANLKNASNTHPASELLLNSDSPGEKGMELFNQFKNYRNELVETVGRTEVKMPFVKDINDYTDEADLRTKVLEQISSKVPNPRDNQQAITDIYVLLTLPNLIDGNNWATNSFEHSSLIGCISTLTILQNKILQARAFALAHITSIGCFADYGFDKIIPFAQGPSLIYEGETAEITVGIAAFDSYNQPEVTLQSIDGEILKSGQGTGKVRVKPSEGLQKIKGTVSIRNKSGTKKTENWEWDIRVLPKKQ